VLGLVGEMSLSKPSRRSNGNVGCAATIWMVAGGDQGGDCRG
jgi:hypothetical protein